jgi:transposase
VIRIRARPELHLDRTAGAGGRRQGPHERLAAFQAVTGRRPASGKILTPIFTYRFNDSRGRRTPSSLIWRALPGFSGVDGYTAYSWLARDGDRRKAEIDSNIVERAIRPQTITRKNALFAGSDGGGRTWATIATLLQTAKMNDVDPFAWLTQTLERLANRWPISQIENLMPWNYKA